MARSVQGRELHIYLIGIANLRRVFLLHRKWCQQRLMTIFEWKQHFTNCLWKCPDCDRKPLKRKSHIAEHIRYHERQQSKIARLNQEQ